MEIQFDGEKPVLPGLNDQAKFVALARAKEIYQAIEALCQKPSIDLPLLLNGEPVNESDYPTAHLLAKDKGYEPPHPDLVKAYFDQLKAYDSQYTEAGIAKLLGLSNGRAIRGFKSGDRPVPFAVWRRFLVATGRAPIDMPDMVGFFK
jgi:hypothetical protein